MLFRYLEVLKLFDAPEIFKNIPDIAMVYKVNDKQIDDLENAVEQLDNDIFFETMGEDRVFRWEKILKIVPPDNQSLKDRITRVQMKVLEKMPYSFRVIRRKLDALLKGEYKFIVKNTELIFNCSIQDRNLFKDVIEMLEEIVPLNLSMSVTNTIIHNEKINESEIEKFLFKGIYLKLLLEEENKEVLSMILRTTCKNNEQAEAMVIKKKNDWYLDGTFLLSGEKMLNAEVKKEVL